MLTMHMAQHILLMNVLAPVVAWLLRRQMSERLRLPLLAATLAQLALLWAVHAPPVFALTSHHGGLHALVQVALFLGAFLFWSAVFAVSGRRLWQPMIALLMTSKLFCLLGALLVFSPRLLFDGAGHHAGTLEDQHLAGLLMLIACPASYLLAGVVLAARWFTTLEVAAANSARPGPVHG